MGYRLWIVVILLAGLFVWGVRYVVTPNDGDAEFQKMLAAMQQVKSFRGVYVDGTHHSERLWEVDCSRSILHKQSQDLQTGADAPQIKEDEFVVGSDQLYTHKSDGSWEKTKYTAAVYSASWYCENLAQGTVRDLVPNVREMLRHAMIGKGAKKTVNGVRCQDWTFVMKSSYSGQKGTVCIGLDDHLPHEMTTDDGARYSYGDYNQPIQFDAPEAVLQAASPGDGAN
jgi:hypothetical protein